LERSRVVYFVNGSISSWRVLFTLGELGLDYAPRRLRVMKEPKDTRAPSFLALNPRGKAPVLVEPDGIVLNESLAILPYLAMRYPLPALVPSPHQPRHLAEVLRLVQEAETFSCAYAPLEQLFVTPPLLASPDLKASIREAREHIAQELIWWNERAHTPFLAGDALSLADCSFYPVLAYLQRRGLSLAEYPQLLRYARDMEARPAARAARPLGWPLGDVGRVNLFALSRPLGGAPHL
jgi:glutathione S-transferase